MAAAAVGPITVPKFSWSSEQADKLSYEKASDYKNEDNVWIKISTNSCIDTYKIYEIIIKHLRYMQDSFTCIGEDRPLGYGPRKFRILVNKNKENHVTSFLKSLKQVNSLHIDDNGYFYKLGDNRENTYYSNQKTIKESSEGLQKLYDDTPPLPHNLQIVMDNPAVAATNNPADANKCVECVIS